MGLSSTTNRVQFTGDGSSTVFSFPYYFFAPADLSVFLFDVNSSIVTPQTLNTNYTVAGNVNAQGVYPSGGSVVMASAFPSSYQVVITRNPSPIQNYALYQNGPINSLALVQQLDYLTTLVQRLQDEVGRCIHMPDGLGTGNNGAFDPTLPQTMLNNSSAYAPITLNSGATGFQLGVVATGQSGAIGYAGILPVLNGGTGQGGLLTQAGVMYGVNANTMGVTSAGAANTVLTAAGGSSAPTWSTVSFLSASGVLSVTNGGTGKGSWTPTQLVFASTASVLAQIPFVSLNTPNTVVLRDANGNFNVQLNSSAVGVLPILNGGTGGSSNIQALTNLWPAGATRGDILVVNSSGLVTRLGIGTDNQALFANSSAVNTTGLLWQNPSSSPLSVTTKTANYTMTANDDFVFVSSSGFTVGLPDATTATKKIYRIGKTDSPVAQIILSASGAQTIGSFGTSVNFWTLGECWELVPDSVGWQVIDHKTSTPWTDFPSLNFGTLWTSTLNQGALSTNQRLHSAKWRRNQRNMDIRWEYAATTAGSSGTGSLLFNLFSGVTIDSSVITVNSGVAVSSLCVDSPVGTIGGVLSTTNQLTGTVYCYSLTQLKLYITTAAAAAAAEGVWGGTGLYDFASNPLNINFNASAPIVGWQP